MKQYIYAALLAAMASYSGIVAAATSSLVDHGNYTTDITDPAHPLDWLDVAFTLNKTYAEVNSILGLAGTIPNQGDGWHYATDQQFLDMINHYTGDNYTDNGFHQQDASTIAGLTALFGSGPTGSGQCYNTCTYGLVESASRDGSLWAAGISYKVYHYPHPPEDDGIGTNPHAYPYDTTSNNATLGSFLVRDSISAVPLPLCLCRPCSVSV